MKRHILTLWLSICLALGSFGIGWSGDFQKGVEAYNKGDFATALKEWTPLAEQGNVKAQYNLGLMYALGEGVIQDNVYAYMWWNIAASTGLDNAKKNKKIVTEKMTSSQIEEAQRLARECVKKNYKGC